MFNLQPTPPPPLHSLILRSILQHLGHAVPVPGHAPLGYHPVFQPPAQVNPGPLGNPTLGSGPNQPGQQVPGSGPLPVGSLGSGPNQPGQPVPGVIAPDPYGGGGNITPFLHLLRRSY